MLYILSSINLVKNQLVKLWSIKWVRYALILGFTYYLGEGFYARTASRINFSTLTIPTWSSIFYIPNIEFNPNFIKSNKASFSIINALTKLGSIFTPGLLMVAIILFLQKCFNTYKAPPLPIIYRGEDAEDIVEEDYTLPVLFTKGECFDDDEDDDDEEDYDLESEGVMI